MRTKVLNPLRILVTDAHSRVGLGAIRSLGRAGHTVIASFSKSWPWPTSASSRYCSEVVRSPNPRYHQSLFREWLFDQAHRHIIDAILPITEASLVGVTAVRKELPSDVLPIIPSDGALEYALSKFHATRMALAVEVPCPTTVFHSSARPTSADREELQRLRFPVIIKTDNYFTTKGGYGRGRCIIARNLHHAYKVLNRLAQLQTRMIVQEFIPGSGAGAFLLRFHGKTHLSFAHRRLHEYPYTGGRSSFRESCRDEELVRLGERLLEAIDYDGVAMVEFRRDARNERPYFIEINGRLWGSLALALHCGVDFPAALVRCHVLGCPPPHQGNYPVGVRCRNVFPGEVRHLRSILGAPKHSRGRPTPPRLRAVVRFFVLFFDPRIRHDYFWWSDPLPGIRQAWGMVQWFRRRLWRKLWRNGVRRHAHQKRKRRDPDRNRVLASDAGKHAEQEANSECDFDLK